MSWVDNFAAELVAEYDGNLLDYGPEDQRQRVSAALRRFDRHTPLRPYVETINAFGFATVQTCLAPDPKEPTGVYLRLLPLAEQIGIPPGQAHRWAENEHSYALQDQRAMDEERGQLGWECLRSVVCLDLALIVDDETAKPDASGRRWSYASEWLLRLDRLMALLLVSPWGHEFMANSKAMFSYAFQKSGLEARATDVHAIEKRENPDGTTGWSQSDLTLADAIARDRDGVTEQEAIGRAFSGPAGALRCEET